MWLWVQIKPGMMILPVASNRCASAGIDTALEAPTAVTFP
jgi:hypothetical protein